jgi:hypothetical protein
MLANIHFGAAMATLSGFPPSAQHRLDCNGPPPPQEFTGQARLPNSHAGGVSRFGNGFDGFTNNSLVHVAEFYHGNSQTGKGLCKLIHSILESLARHKLGGVGGADLNFCAGLRGLHEDERHIKKRHWGLVPFWAKDISIGSRMINARVETVTSKPAFRGCSQTAAVPDPRKWVLRVVRKGREQTALLFPFAFR